MLVPPPAPPSLAILTRPTEIILVSPVPWVSMLPTGLESPQHLLNLASVENDALGEELNVIWELEPGARIVEKVAPPEPTGFDRPDQLVAFLDAVRWGASSPADDGSTVSPRSNTQTREKGIPAIAALTACPASWNAVPRRLRCRISSTYEMTIQFQSIGCFLRYAILMRISASVRSRIGTKAGY